MKKVNAKGKEKELGKEAVKTARLVIGSCMSFFPCVAVLKEFFCRTRCGNKDARKEEKEKEKKRKSTKALAREDGRSDAGSSAPFRARLRLSK